MSPLDERDLCREILSYLKQNPKGSDTVYGIARFWILQQRIEVEIGKVEHALVKLLELGFLSEKILRDTSGNVIERYYQLNPSRLQEVDSFLENGT